MSILLPVQYKNKHCYDIIIDRTFDNLITEMSKQNISNRKICIVTEDHVGPLYAQNIKNHIMGLSDSVFIYEFKAGEISKNLETVNGLYEFLIKNKFDRNDILLALGGGVVGDLTGFTAATYLRGIRFIQVPTSLLSQVDSSIGGKTGVDFKGYKNMVGAFKQPILVYINVSTLDTLTDREFLSGMGEIIKHGLIKDKVYLQWLDDNIQKVMNHDKEALSYMIGESCKIKRAVVEIDPKETLGERALLNFGHTYGHAIEKLMNFTLLHGECVAIGMVASLYLSYLEKNISYNQYEDAVKIIKKYKLPTHVESLNIDEVIDTMFSDKKMDSGILKFVLLKDIGNAIVDKTIDLNKLKEAFKAILVQ